MNCDRCGQPSVYHSTYIINGVSKSTNLCRDCAIKEGVFTNQKVGLFDDLFSDFADLISFEKVDNLICPVCKTSLKDFRSTGKLGCPNCYDIFREEICNVVKRIAPFERHSQDLINMKQKEKPKTKEEQIKELRDEMKLAVEEERYEDAAKIKKQINKLENANE